MFTQMNLERHVIRGACIVVMFEAFREMLLSFRDYWRLGGLRYVPTIFFLTLSADWTPPLGYLPVVEVRYAPALNCGVRFKS